MKKLQLIKAGFLFFFSILCFGEGNAQEAYKWSSWKSDSVFEDFQIRYRKIYLEDAEKFFYEIECRNQFPHKLSYILVLKSKNEKTDYLRMEIGANKINNINTKKRVYPKDLEIHSYYTSLMPAWGIHLN